MKSVVLLAGLLFANIAFAQIEEIPALKQYDIGEVEVRTSYNKNTNSTLFSVYNNAPVPLFINVDFKEVSSLSFFEEQPYVKRIQPGFNDLFELKESRENGYPKYPYRVRIFPSNPLAKINTDFVYLLPFEANQKALLQKGANPCRLFPKISNRNDAFVTWFRVHESQAIVACRKGIVVAKGTTFEKDSVSRISNHCNYITLLHNDGTLASYIHVVANKDQAELNKMIFPGEVFAKNDATSNELGIVLYYNKFSENELFFLVPKFQLGNDKAGIPQNDTTYRVEHPDFIRALEMSKKERKKILGKK